MPYGRTRYSRLLSRITQTDSPAALTGRLRDRGVCFRATVVPEGDLRIGARQRRSDIAHLAAVFGGREIEAGSAARSRVTRFFNAS